MWVLGNEPGSFRRAASAKPSLQFLCEIFKILKNLKSFKLVLSCGRVVVCGYCPDTGAGSGGTGPHAYFQRLFMLLTEDPGKGLSNTHGKLQGETAEEGNYDMPSP